ncbi:MAG: AarF/UbiB family protein [Pseudomonadota bacterium]
MFYLEVNLTKKCFYFVIVFSLIFFQNIFPYESNDQSPTDVILDDGEYVSSQTNPDYIKPSSLVSFDNVFVLADTLLAATLELPLGGTEEEVVFLVMYIVHEFDLHESFEKALKIEVQRRLGDTEIQRLEKLGGGSVTIGILHDEMEGADYLTAYDFFTNGLDEETASGLQRLSRGFLQVFDFSSLRVKALIAGALILFICPPTRPIVMAALDALGIACIFIAAKNGLDIIIDSVRLGLADADLETNRILEELGMDSGEFLGALILVPRGERALKSAYSFFRSLNFASAARSPAEINALAIRQPMDLIWDPGLKTFSSPLPIPQELAPAALEIASRNRITLLEIPKTEIPGSTMQAPEAMPATIDIIEGLTEGGSEVPKPIASRAPIQSVEADTLLKEKPADPFLNEEIPGRTELLRQTPKPRPEPQIIMEVTLDRGRNLNLPKGKYSPISPEAPRAPVSPEQSPIQEPQATIAAGRDIFASIPLARPQNLNLPNAERQRAYQELTQDPAETFDPFAANNKEHFDDDNRFEDLQVQSLLLGNDDIEKLYEHHERTGHEYSVRKDDTGEVSFLEGGASQSDYALLAVSDEAESAADLVLSSAHIHPGLPEISIKDAKTFIADAVLNPNTPRVHEIFGYGLDGKRASLKIYLEFDQIKLIREIIIENVPEELLVSVYALLDSMFTLALNMDKQQLEDWLFEGVAAVKVSEEKEIQLDERIKTKLKDAYFKPGTSVYGIVTEEKIMLVRKPSAETPADIQFVWQLEPIMDEEGGKKPSALPGYWTMAPISSKVSLAIKHSDGSISKPSRRRTPMKFIGLRTPMKLSFGDVILFGFEEKYEHYEKHLEFNTPMVPAHELELALGQDGIRWRVMRADDKNQQIYKKVKANFELASSLLKKEAGIPLTVPLVIEQSVEFAGYDPEYISDFNDFGQIQAMRNWKKRMLAKVLDIAKDLLTEYSNISGFRIYVIRSGDIRVYYESPLKISSFRFDENVLENDESRYLQLEFRKNTAGLSGLEAAHFTMDPDTIPGQDEILPPFDAQEFKDLFRTGIINEGKLALAIRLIEHASPEWQRVIKKWKELVEKRGAEIEDKENAFPISFNLKSSWSRRGKYTDTRNELSDEIGLRRNASVFTLAHELGVHAMPINERHREVAALPYKEISDYSGAASFEAILFHLLDTRYQEEAQASYGAALLYRDLIAIGIPKDWLAPDEVEFFEKILDIINKEGISGYIRSRIYLGANHTRNYNKGKLLQLAALARANPALLADPSVEAVIAEHGVQIKTDSPLALLMTQAKKAIDEPSSANMAALTGTLLRSGATPSVDIPGIMSRVNEYKDLISGNKDVESTSFLGKQEATQNKVKILSAGRRQYEKYKLEFEEALQKATGIAKDINWSDPNGLLAFYRMTILIARQASGKEKTYYEDLIKNIAIVIQRNLAYIPKVDRIGGEIERSKIVVSDLLYFERARLERNLEKMLYHFGRISVSQFELFQLPLTPIAVVNNEEYLEKEKSIQRTNLGLRILTEALQDSYVKGNIPKAEIKKFILKVITKFRKYNQKKYYKYLYKVYHSEINKGDPKALEAFLITILAYDEEGILADAAYNLSKKWGSSPTTPAILAALLQARLGGLRLPLPGQAAKYGAINYGQDPLHSNAPYDKDWWRSVPVADDYDSEIGYLPGLYSALEYHRQLYNLWENPSKQHPFKDTNTYNQTIASDMPTFIWLDGPFPLPDSVVTFPSSQNAFIEQGLAVPSYAQMLRQLHYEIMMHKLNSEKAIPPIVFLRWNEEFKLALSEIGTDELSDLNQKIKNTAIWVIARLIVEASKMAATQGYLDIAQTMLDSSIESRQGGSLPAIFTLFNEAIQSALFTIAFFALPKEADRISKLEEIISEYKTMVELRRAGITPTEMLMFVKEFALNRAFRQAANELLHLASEHIAKFNPSSFQFREGVTLFIQIVNAANLTNEEKDNLLYELFDKVLPKVKKEAIGLDIREQIALFDWMDTAIFTRDTLEIISIYAKTESLIFARAKYAIDRIGSAKLPLDIRGRILNLAYRIEHYIDRVSPEIKNESNEEKLGRVSKDSDYQVALADVFPSRKVSVDLTMPVGKWNPVMVRRGLDDPTSAWEKIRLAIGGLTSAYPDLSENNIFNVYTAFVNNEIERAAKPSSELQEGLNTYQAFVERKTKGEDPRLNVAVSGSALGLKIFSAIEKVQLTGLLKIPAIAFALDLAEKTLSAHGELGDFEKEVLASVLEASNVPDARRKRELFLYIVNDSRYPIETRRIAAKGLAYASTFNKVLSALIEGYEKNPNHLQEKRLYCMVCEYWKRIGRLPDDYGMLILDENKNDPDNYFSKFDEALSDKELTIANLDAIKLESLSLKYGKYASLFITEISRYLEAKAPHNFIDSCVFKDDILKLIPPTTANIAKARQIMKKINFRKQERDETLDLLKLDLPNALMDLPKELKFIALRFFKQMPQDQLFSLIEDLKHIEKSQGRAETFCYLFERVGLPKLGQALSTMYGIIPTAERQVFARLFDQVPPSSSVEIKRTVERELRKPMHLLFATWDDVPIASASMGDVFKATLPDGREVFVKVAPDSKYNQNLQVGIETLSKVADDFEAAVKMGRFSLGIDIPSLIRRWLNDYRIQLSFLKEMRNGDKFRQRGYLVPEYLHEMSTQRVLVMLPASGKKLNELDDPGQRKEAAILYARQALKMLLIDKSFHKDPHPGNVFFEPETGLSWIDWGITGFITQDKLNKLFSLLMFLYAPGAKNSGQLKTLQRFLTQIASEASLSTGFDDELLRQGIDQLDWSLPPADNLVLLIDLAGQAGLYIDPEIMEAINFLLTVNGVVMDLDPGHNLLPDFMWVMSKR